MVTEVTSAFGPAADRRLIHEIRDKLMADLGDVRDGISLDELNDRLQHVMERHTLELMEPGSHDRPMAIAALRALVRIGVTGTADDLWERAAKIDADTWPSLTQLIGVGAGVLDRWYGSDEEDVDEAVENLLSSSLDLDEEMSDLCIEMLEHAAEHTLFDNLRPFIAQYGGSNVYDAILACLIEALRWSIVPEVPELEEQLERIS
jgi:hypothetical protein